MKYLLLSLLLISCGAKTLNKEQKKTDSTSVATQVVKTDSTSTDSTSIKFDVATEEIIIEAVDSTKPIEITNNEGKVTKYKNARISHKKRKDNTIVIKEKTVNKIVVDSATNEIEVNKVESSKIVYKEQFNWGTFILQLWWLWLLIIIACYVAYRYYKGAIKFPLL
jgi:nitrogen fixation/metabolism regulation signal transduction histidine kinase